MVFARTMPDNPHWYTPRASWADDAAFIWTIEIIRAHGRRRRYHTYYERVLDVGDWFYWTGFMWPRSTYWINRKPLSAKPPVDLSQLDLNPG